MTTNGANERSPAAKPQRRKPPSGRRRKARRIEPEETSPVSIEADSDRVGEAHARLGTTIGGKWTLDALLGVGGMAAVYAATHRNGNRVALKLLHPTLAHSRSLRERFLREGYVANRVDDPGVVRVLDDDELEDGTTFLVMELLAGETLEARWERCDQRLGVDEVLAIGDELLRVLDVAHAKGIHHRDIKPENVFLTTSGDLKVLDFGIARLRDAMPGSATATRTGIALGTPAFMPPEQALGKNKEIDGRADLWAVGATMFTLLAGRFVHVTDSPSEMLVKAATERAPSIASVVPDLPAEVAAVIDRALSFEREARFPDATAMRAALADARRVLELPSTVVSGDAADDASDDPTPPGERPTVPSSMPPPISAALPEPVATTVPVPTRRAPRSRGRAVVAIGLALAGVAGAFALAPLVARGEPVPAAGEASIEALTVAVAEEGAVSPPSTDEKPPEPAPPAPTIHPSAPAATAKPVHRGMRRSVAKRLPSPWDRGH